MVYISHSEIKQIPYNKWNSGETNSLILLRVLKAKSGCYWNNSLDHFRNSFDGRYQPLGLLIFEFIVILPFTNYETWAI